ncbi:MAG: sigma-54-dependent Fis family transcriptional regulator, partial [Leptothrix sp. (in: b-proteobacteria)]
MNALSERERAHAGALRARGHGLPPEGAPGPDILDSWVRSAAAGLDLASAKAIPVLEAAQLKRRRDAVEPVRRLALAELETLMQQIAGSNYLLAFADRDGVVLDLYADARFRSSGRGDEVGLVAGSVWSEAEAGTNGLGTALVTGHSVSVTGLEHYFLRYADIACAAAPIRDAHGEVVGALDASSYFESRQRHTQALVQMSATHIENLLLVQQMSGDIVLALHPRQEFLGTLSAALLAIDAHGCISAFNARAASLLTGLNLARGIAFDAVFDEPYARLVSRLRPGAELRLRDALGSIVHAGLVHAPIGLLQPRPALRLPLEA